jgi:cytochrome oxidase Cu insertion factor (SCO1/SenC/PrrC family)
MTNNKIEVIALQYVARKKSHNMTALYQSYASDTQRIFISVDTRKDTADFMEFKSTLDNHDFIFLKHKKPNIREIVNVAKQGKHIFLVVPHYLQRSVARDLTKMLEDLA